MASFSPKQMRQTARIAAGTTSTTEKEQHLREQIQNELVDKIKYCANPTYECSMIRLDGYDYCIRHILRDPHANYRQCTHVYPNGRKCINAVPKYDNKKEQILTTLCFEHNRQTQLQKTYVTVGRLRNRVETNETLLNSLAHHINVEDIKQEVLKVEPDEDEIDVVSPHVTPFVNQDYVNNIGQVVSSVRKRRRILEYASDSSSNDDNPPCLNNTARDLEFFESDYESVDSEEDDPLKHAGIYTRPEAVRMAESKLIKLQGMYRDQLTHLQHVLKQRRRSYLHDLRKERETYCSIHDQLKDTPHERKIYEQLKALNSYHRRQGVEAVLYKKMKDKRARARDPLSAHKTPSFPKCVFTEGGVKCGERTLPLCKHCRKHILEDKRQVLFQACGVEKSGVVCQEPVASIFDDSTCVLHLSVGPVKRQYEQKFFGMADNQAGQEFVIAVGVGPKHNYPKLYNNPKDHESIDVPIPMLETIQSLHFDVGGMDFYEETKSIPCEESDENMEKIFFEDPSTLYAQNQEPVYADANNNQTDQNEDNFNELFISDLPLENSEAPQNVNNILRMIETIEAMHCFGASNNKN